MEKVDKNEIYNKTTLYASGASKEARMVFQDYKKYPRLTVFVKDKATKKNTVEVSVAINRIALSILVSELKTLSDKKEDYSFTIDMFSPVWENDVQTTEVKLAGGITVKRHKVNEQVINYMVIKGTSENTFIFKLMPTPYVKLSVNDRILTDAESSVLWTKAYATTLEDIFKLFLETYQDVGGKNNFTKDKVITSDTAVSINDY